MRLQIITANSALEYFPAETVERFEEALLRGLPTIVFSHVPMEDKLMGLTESYHPNVRLTEEDYRISNRMRDALLHDPRVITTVTGHWHSTNEQLAPVIDGKTHYITPGLFAGICRMIEIL